MVYRENINIGRNVNAFAIKKIRSHFFISLFSFFLAFFLSFLIYSSLYFSLYFIFSLNFCFYFVKKIFLIIKKETQIPNYLFHYFFV